MSARLVNVMKKWWMIALVFALALSLTSCSKKRDTQSSQGFGYCDGDGSMGQFDVYVKPRTGEQNRYDVVVIPYSLTASGDIAAITVVQKSSMQFKEMITQVVLNPGQQILVGTLSKAEINQYDVLAITSYVAGVNFLQANPAKKAICTLPYPGDNLTQ